MKRTLILGLIATAISVTGCPGPPIVANSESTPSPTASPTASPEMTSTPIPGVAPTASPDVVPTAPPRYDPPNDTDDTPSDEPKVEPTPVSGKATPAPTQEPKSTPLEPDDDGDNESTRKEQTLV